MNHLLKNGMGDSFPTTAIEKVLLIPFHLLRVPRETVAVERLVWIYWLCCYYWQELYLLLKILVW